MKRIITCWILLCFCYASEAQTFNEWFRQKKTQIKYLVNQVAALQVYIEFAQKGYQIANDGLTIIGKIKNGDFSLHNIFFEALKSVNPKIRNSAQVAGIIELQLKLMQSHKNAIKKAQQSEYLTVKEVDYLVQVYSRLLEGSLDNIEELTTLLTANQYELSDEERMKRIDLLYKDMQDKHQFIQWFSGQTDVLLAGRRKETQEAGILQSLMKQNE